MRIVIKFKGLNYCDRQKAHKVIRRFRNLLIRKCKLDLDFYTKYYENLPEIELYSNHPTNRAKSRFKGFISERQLKKLARSLTAIGNGLVTFEGVELDI